MRKLIGICICLALLVAMFFQVAQAKPNGPLLPDGFRLLLSDRGVQLYKKEYPNGNPDYVQMINLESGASLKLLHAQIVEPRVGKGGYGGDDPRFSAQPLGTFWNEVKSDGENVFCVTNGLFFYMLESPTRLAFPLKVAGKVVTDGFSIEQFAGQKLMLELWPDRARITALSQNALYASTAPDIIAGLAEDANKRANRSVGRTFVGVDDQDGDRVYETVLILNTVSALQTDVAQTLRDFGADKVMMLDGGGSTQLICQGTPYIASERPIPQAIAVLAAPVPPLSASLFAPDSWLVALEDEPVQFDILLKNTGTETWEPDVHQFILEKSAASSQQALSFQGAVQPGESVTVTVRLAAYSHEGVYSTTLPWHIERRGETSSDDVVELQFVVLPAALDAERQALQREIDEQAAQPDADIPGLLEDWSVAHEVKLDATSDEALIQLQNIVWIPLIMLPFIAIVFFFILKTRRQDYEDDEDF